MMTKAANLANPATKAALKATNMKDIVDGGYVLIGSPDEVVEQIRHVGTSLNVGHLMLLLQYGNMSKDTTKYNTRLFAEKVMPKVKDLFGDWEDKWWPKPMAKGQRAAVPAFRPQTRRGGVSLVSEPKTTHRRGQRLPLPRLDQGQRAQARLPRRPGRPAALAAVPRQAGRDAHGDRAVAAGLSRRDRPYRCSTRISTGCWRCASSSTRAGLAGADLVGASVGGAFAAEMAAIFPAHVRKLALIAPFGLFDEEEPAADPVGAAQGQRRRPDVRRRREMERAGRAARRRQFDRMADRDDARLRSRRPRLLAARQYPAGKAAAA